MKTTVLSTLSLVSLAQAGFDTWAPPGPYDNRGPCPMLNTLTNHGFFPHHGRDFTKEETEKALFEALNINKTVAGFLFDFALTTNPIQNATTFSLNDLGNHNVLEHDASLSRPDAYFGDVLRFNHTIFEETKSYWTDDIIDMRMAAEARLGRILTSKATNPEYTMSPLGDDFTYGESVAYVILLGDKHSGTANRSWVEYLFENERLPLHLGWERSSELFTDVDLFGWMEKMKNITATLPGANTTATPAARRLRRGTHWGF